jgi:imidazolonepropionase
LLLLTNISQLITLQGPPPPRRGVAGNDIGLVRDGMVFCAAGRVVAAGTEAEVRDHPTFKQYRRGLDELDCSGCVVMPGFVDAHTHPAFMGPRLIDFEKRIGGAGYEEIAAAGGGIRSSIAAVREASRAALKDEIRLAFGEMLAHGTTTVEAKSGYGLSLDSEIKSLEAVRDAAKDFPGTVVPTFLGAHVVPPEYKERPEEYVRLICEEMIPQVAKRKLAMYVDAFCERSAFTSEQTEYIFDAARRHGLDVRVHVGQFTACALSPLLERKPASLDHMDHYEPADLARIAASEAVVTLVPGANYFLGDQRYPDARAFIAAGVPLALATDYNPGTSPCLSMQFMLSLACTHMKMTPAEAITAATVNGAHALDLSYRKGRLEEGRDADIAIFDVRDHRELAYWFGGNLCKRLVVRGKVL